MRTKELRQRISTPHPRPTRTTTILALVAAATLSACADLDMETAQIVEVQGYSVTVRTSANEPNTWAAFGTTIADRAQITPAYLNRNIIAIEAVSGCAVRPELTTHSVATTLAVVAC